MGRSGLRAPGAFALAHNVPRREDVTPLLHKLAAAGGTLLREADAPLHGGYRGYVADPDEHAWEIAWNPAWAIDANGSVTFGL
jgi:predicted lactoylglutathione lyase